MKSIFDLLTSRAKILVLRVLYFQHEPVPLRHISALSGLPVFSVQNAVDLLFDEGTITRSERDNNVLFELDRKYPLYNVLEQFFVAEVGHRIRLQSGSFNERACRVLEFAAGTNKVFKRARQRKAA